MELTKEKARELFDYSDGVLYWKKRKWARRAGQQVGGMHRTGYLITTIGNKQWLVHRIIFLWVNGFLPEFVDHIDGNPLNNKAENLRPATMAQNSQNRGFFGNSYGIKGVVWNRNLLKWQATIKANGESKYLGVFSTREEAAAEYEKAAKILHGEYARRDAA